MRLSKRPCKNQYMKACQTWSPSGRLHVWLSLVTWVNERSQEIPLPTKHMWTPRWTIVAALASQALSGYLHDKIDMMRYLYNTRCKWKCLWSGFQHPCNVSRYRSHVYSRCKWSLFSVYSLCAKVSDDIWLFVVTFTGPTWEWCQSSHVALGRKMNKPVSEMLGRSLHTEAPLVSFSKLTRSSTLPQP